jgi:CRP-like cAMP-binding protein
MNSWPEEINESCDTCEFTENLNLLRQVDFFSALPTEALKLATYLSAREHFQAGEVLFREGDDDGRAMYVVSGLLQAYREVDGKETALFSLEPGDLLGRLSLLGGIQRLFTLYVETDAVCLILSREKFARVLTLHPEAYPKLVRVIVENVTAWEKRLIKNTSGVTECRHNLGVSLI